MYNKYTVQVFISRCKLNKATNSLKSASVAQRELHVKLLPTGLKASNLRKTGSITRVFGEPEPKGPQDFEAFFILKANPFYYPVLLIIS